MPRFSLFFELLLEFATTVKTAWFFSFEKASQFILEPLIQWEWCHFDFKQPRISFGSVDIGFVFLFFRCDVTHVECMARQHGMLHAWQRWLRPAANRAESVSVHLPAGLQGFLQNTWTVFVFSRCLLPSLVRLGGKFFVVLSSLNAQHFVMESSLPGRRFLNS